MQLGSSDNPWVLPGSLTGVCLAVLAGGSLYLAMAFKPVHTSPPASFAVVTAPDKSFKVEGPSGWKQETTGNGSELSVIIFQQGGARVKVISDTAGSLMADIARSPAPMDMPSGEGGEGVAAGGGAAMPDLSSIPGAGSLGLAARKSPIEALHEKGKEDYEESLAKSGYSAYQEQEAQKIAGGFGEGRISEFTSHRDGLGGGDFHGYRVTFLSSEKRIQLMMRCGEGDWAGMKPAFMKIAQSVGPGS